jgi:macrolide-specific efflux system membrane fusion protein
VLLPQMTAQVFFVAAEARDVLMVPVAALTMQRAQRPAPAAAAAEPVDGEVVKTATPAPAQAAPGAGRAAQGNWRRNRAANSPATPRSATVKVAQADGAIVERAVMVGVSNRVSAQILSGLNEGEKVVVGQKLPDAPVRTQQPGTNRPLGAPGAIGGGGTGGPRR